MKKLNDLIGSQQKEVLEMINRENQPSIFEEFDGFDVLILRRLLLTQEALNFWSETFLFVSDQIYYFDRSHENFILLKNNIDELYELLTDFYEHNQKIIVGYSNEIESLEDCLFERNVPRHFMDMWFNIKRDIARFENFYYRNLIVFREFEKKISAKYPDVTGKSQDIRESINFQNASVTSLKSRLDSIHHYYDSIKQERLNKTLLTLTIVSSIFLPMNLIVGFFGMNTEGLFFKENPQGTLNVIYLLCVITLVTLLGVKVFKWVDQFMLRFILGKFNFYKNISKRFHDLEDRFRVP